MPFKLTKHTEIRRATMGDVLYIAENLRDTDKKEIRAFTGHDPTEMVKDSFFASRVSWTLWYQDRPAVISGLVLHRINVGLPWLVGTKALDFQIEVKRTLAFNSKMMLDRYHEEADFLYNFISEDNMFTVGWLDWLGFTIRRFWGIRNGVPFAYVFHFREEPGL